MKIGSERERSCGAEVAGCGSFAGRVKNKMESEPAYGSAVANVSEKVISYGAILNDDVER